MAPEVEALPGFSSLVVGPLAGQAGVGVVQLARPAKNNAFHREMWDEFPKALQALQDLGTTRAVVLCGQGKNFCAGIDVAFLQQQFLDAQRKEPCPGRMREQMRLDILKLQEVYSALEQFKWPVVAAVHGCCIGGGIDMITACDIRLCSEDATFCVKEVDLAIAADLGTLQRLPHIVGHGAALDLALTARTMDSGEAMRLKLVTRIVAGGAEGVMAAACQLAAGLAAKPALALAGTKRVLLHTRDHPRVADGLDYVATWNSAVLLSDEIQVAMRAGARGARPPSKL